MRTSIKTSMSVLGCLFFLLCLISCSGLYDASQSPKENSFMSLAQSRYAVRKYSSKPVEKEKVEAILEAGRIAPTAANLQPQRIYVIQSKEGLAKIDSLTSCRYGAPLVLLFAYDSDADWKNALEKGVHSGVEDVSIVATHCMLEATELGLGTVWVNVFPNSEMERIFDLPKSERSVLIMPVGYKAEDALPSKMHSERLPLSATVRYR